MIITLPCYLLLRPDSEVVFTQIIRSLHGEYTAQFGDANTIHWHPTKRNNQIEKQEEITQSVASSPGSVTYPQRSNCVKCEYNFICTAMMGSTKSCFVRENIPSVHLKMPPSYILIYIQVAALPDKRNSTHTSVRIENIKKYWVLMNLNLSLYLPAPGKSFFPNTSQMFLFVCLCTYFPKPGLSTLAPPPLWFLAPDDRLTKWDCSGDKWREKHLEFKLIWHFHPKGGRTYICPAGVGSWQEMKDFRMIDLHLPPPIKLRNLSCSYCSYCSYCLYCWYCSCILIILLLLWLILLIFLILPIMLIPKPSKSGCFGLISNPTCLW